MASEGARRAQILEAAAALFASAGFRITLKEIAAACGIHQGSLYHHFDSKETIILELVRACVDDLNGIAEAALSPAQRKKDVETRIVELGRAIASCGVHHRAALLLTLYDPPSTLGNELAELAAQIPTAIENSMLKVLRLGKTKGVVREGMSLPLLSDRLCQGMLTVGVGLSHLDPNAKAVPDLRLRILLHGLAPKAPSNDVLDKSAAIRAVEAVVAGWEGEHDDGDVAAHLRNIARREFGARGYETATMRDIAAAAKLNPNTVYRLFASKDDLLMSIMGSYVEKVDDIWNEVLRADSSPLEQIDALMLANIHVVDRFRDESRIQRAWLRQSPPNALADLGTSVMAQLRKLKALLGRATKVGEIAFDAPNADLRSRVVYEAITSTQHIVAAAGGVSEAHELARHAVIRGVLTRE